MSPSSPRRGTATPRSGTGTDTAVWPAYPARRGRDAKSGMAIFTRQGTSRTSSAKPRRTMKHTLAIPAL